MDEKLYKLNRTYAIVDTIICITAVLAFTFCAWWFNRWWITLFNVLTILLYNQHTLLLESDMEKAVENDGKDA